MRKKTRKKKVDWKFTKIIKTRSKRRYWRRISRRILNLKSSNFDVKIETNNNAFDNLKRYFNYIKLKSLIFLINAILSYNEIAQFIKFNIAKAMLRKNFYDEKTWYWFIFKLITQCLNHLYNVLKISFALLTF